jgi:CheY-like chemotaxis protein
MGNSGYVLVIDDEDIVQEAIGDLLRHIGFDVLFAAHGQEGVDVFIERQDDIRLVFVDLLMPVMDGRATCQELRRVAPDVKIILSSGYDELEAADMFAEVGQAARPDVYLQKPYDIPQLIKLVREMTGRPAR